MAGFDDTPALMGSGDSVVVPQTCNTHTANMEIDLVGVGLKLTASDFHHV